MPSWKLFLATVLIGGGVAGGIDILSAALINQAAPATIARAIASGVLGGRAFRGGAPVVLLGLLLQLGMSSFIAALFYGATEAFDILRHHILVAGALYGIPVYLVMTYVVVPLSRAKPHPPGSLSAALPDVLAMILFGAIIAAAPGSLSVLRAGLLREKS